MKVRLTFEIKLSSKLVKRLSDNSFLILNHQNQDYILSFNSIENLRKTRKSLKNRGSDQKWRNIFRDMFER
jgi:hypothetical protein